MSFENLPEAVQDARNRGDHNALSRMGKKGAEKVAQNRSRERIIEELRTAKIAEELQKKLHDANEDIVPPDGDEVNSLL
ncbi:hypothetical protein A2609_03240 [Candidatus Kaiserbacteria bacterium RIFOXYD1_FULL_47_14]|uniref:Uncharacterized protein n=1 Tax=Candidatus Kaiserbacteria bacterium RIFOXYD1_FULL_47_14 TaxID=1798533 RepID=A0A1F6G3T6_9BACT|nr:MAG: hypothetical protein A2609_03240 [Candidatus Kaiserbacteria bacterium RIFOXYD1_FULL_47_14]